MLNEIQYTYHDSDKFGVWELIQKHMATLSCPMDYFSERRLMESKFYLITSENKPIGYSAVKNNRLTGFFMEPLYFHSAGHILEDFLDAMGTDIVEYLIQDVPLVSLISDWVFDILGYEYYVLVNFCPGQMGISKETMSLQLMEQVNLAYLTEISNGYLSPGKLENAQVYEVAEGSEIAGYGLVIKSQMVDVGYVDFFVKPEFRDGKRGGRIVTKLKERAEAQGLRPVGVCHIRNVLTRQAFEASYMAAVGKSGQVRLIERRRLPMQYVGDEGQLY